MASGSGGEGGGATGFALTPRMIVDHVFRPIAAFLFVLVGYKRMVRAITRSILLPSTVIGRNRAHLDMFTKQARVPHRRVLIDGRLDAMILLPPAGDSKEATTGTRRKKQGWLIYSNANGVCYEHILRYTHYLGEFLNRKVCVYNYRGVGYSKGECQGAKDMVEDLASVIDYLHKEHLDEDGKDDFVLWGHSIGGAVSLLTAHYVMSKQKDRQFKVVADRSFSNLEVVVEDKINEGPLAPLISGLLVSSLEFALVLASVFGLGTHPLPSIQDTSSSLAVQALDFARAVGSGVALMVVAMRMSPYSPRPVNWPFLGGFTIQIVLGDMWLSSYALDSLPFFLFASFAFAFEIGVRGKFSGLLKWLVASQGWTMNPGAVLEDVSNGNNKVIATYHPEDEMIPMKAALAEMKAMDRGNVLELEGPALSATGSQANHMYELNTFELERIKQLLEQDRKRE